MGTIEDTVNNLMADYLRSKGILTLAQFSVHVPSGRRQPDFELRNSGLFYGEGEWQSHYLEGYNQAIEFGDIPGCSGYYLIGYPDELRDRIRQKRLTSLYPTQLLSAKSYRGVFKIEGQRAIPFHGPLADIPNWIREAVERKAPREDPEEFVSLMRDIVRGLTEYLPEVRAYPSLFEHVIASMPKDKGEIDSARNAAAYLLLNQVVFYRLLSEGRDYDPIDRSKLTHPRDLKRNYFNRVLKENYQAVFDFDVASLFPDSSLKFMQDMIRIIEDLQPELFTRDLLGNVFHQLIPQNVRKPVAAYYTNPMAARLLAQLSVKVSEDKVADFACGSGTLLMAAYERKAALLGRPFQEQDHRAFIERDLTGIDIMPFAAHLAVIQLALKNPVFWTDRVRIAVYDSTLLKPGLDMSSLQKVMPRGQTKISTFADQKARERAEVSEGAVSPKGAGQRFQLEQVDVVIMNPPFSKKQFIDSEFRKMLNDRFIDRKEFIGNEQAYWAYFVLLADRFLKEGGRLALVVPASILRQEAFAGIREILRKKYSIEHIIATEYRSAFSESSLFREILLIADKSRGAHGTVFTLLNVLPDAQNTDEMTNALTFARANNDVNPLKRFGQARIIKHKDMLESDDWFSFIPGEQRRFAALSELELMSPLGKVVPDTIQGLRLNREEPEMQPANTLLSHKREERTMIDWQILRENKREIVALSVDRGVEVTIPRLAIVQSTRTASGMDKMLIDHTYDYVVTERFKDDQQFWDDAKPDQILLGRNRQIAVRSAYLILAGRNTIDLTAPGTKLLAFCTKKPIAPTWSFWSLRTSSFEEACLLVLWLNSTFMLNQLLEIRKEVRGSRMWFDKTTLLTLPVLDPAKLDQKKKTRLLALFDEVKNTSFPSLQEQFKFAFNVRMKMDIALAETVGLTAFQSEHALRELYAETSAKLDSLKAMMGHDRR